MAPTRRVAVLLHARDRRARERPYMIWALAGEWERAGIEVSVAAGPGELVDADVLVNHVDLTVVPEDHARAFARFPAVVNGRLVDISKRRVSANLLGRDHAWDGPVIVKTDANCGGKSEARFRTAPLTVRAGAAVRTALASLAGPRTRDAARWRGVRRIPTEDYRVFDSLAAVPDAVFDNPSLVVERFLPERDGEGYVLRTWTPFGDRGVSRRLVSRHPVVKSGRLVRREDAPVHPDVLAFAATVGLDFGKIDYVVRDGGAVVLDVNRTPTYGPLLSPPERARSAVHAAGGIEAFFERAARSRGG